MSTEEKKKKYELSHVAFIVLGLVAEEPSHGKILNDKITERGMKDWTKIGNSSVYGVLKSLKQNGLVTSWIEELDNRTVKIYKATLEGLNLLKEKVYSTIHNYQSKNDEDFYVAYGMLPMLSEQEQLRALTHSHETLIEHEKRLQEMLKENANTTICIKGLFKHPAMVVQASIQFIQWTISEIKKGNSRFPKKVN